MLINKFIKILVFMFIFISFATQVFSTVNYYDTWTSSNSSTFDGVVWGGYNLDTYASDYSPYADCLCWDWCDDGSPDSTMEIWDYCDCKDSSVQADCEAYSPFVDRVCNVLGECWVNILNKYHTIGTGSSGDRWQCYIDIREYKDCDNSSGQRGIINHAWDAYQVVYPKKYQCDGEDYDTKGSTDGALWKTWNQDSSCGTYKRCDTDSSHNNHDNQNVYTAEGTIPSPCSTRDGTTSNHSCNVDEDCYSDNCDQQDVWTLECTSDGSDSWAKNVDNKLSSCGGQGYHYDYGYDTGYCSAFPGSAYVCDSDLDGIYYGSFDPNWPLDYCKKNVSESCSQSSDCWNDNDGYNCVGGYCSKCGDGLCSNGESVTSCAQDCCTEYCTAVGGSTCYSICNGTNGCVFYNLSTQTKCNYQSNNTNVCSGPDDYVLCCEGTPVDCGGGQECIGGQCIADAYVDLAIVDVIPIQVVADVDMIKDKSGIVKVTAINYGNDTATGIVSVTFDGVSLTPYPYGSATASMAKDVIKTFYFNFTPTSAGSDKIVNATIEVNE